MVGVLGAPAPVVRGRTEARRPVPTRWRTLATHLVGLLLTAMPTGAVLGALGWALGAPYGWRATAGVLGIAAVLYGLADLRLVRMPHPQRAGQVPNRWRRRYGRVAVAFLYGLALGPGFTVFVRSGAFFVAAVAAAASGSPLAGATVFGLVAAGRFAAVTALSRPRGEVGAVATLTRLRDSTAATRLGVGALGVVQGAALLVAAAGGAGT